MPRMIKALAACWLAALMLLPAGAAAAAPDQGRQRVTLQLKWFNQFQFAGYYAAVEQGYFAEEGLDVTIRERDLGKSVVAQVVSGEADYGVGDSGLLSEYAKGQPVVALAAIFQHNPLVYFTRQDSGIISPYEMRGKRIMSDTLSANEAPLRAMLAGANLSEQDFVMLQQRNEYDLLISGQIDVISGYLTDQPFYYRQQGVKINIINPQNYGIDFYGDILFTSQRELKSHPGRAERFRRAALKGWQYALAHPDQMISLISRRYHSKLSPARLKFEAAETRKLILPQTVPIGHIDPRRFKVVAEHYAAAGFNRALNDADIAGFIYNPGNPVLDLTSAEQAWLDRHPVLRVGIDRDFAPYEWVDADGQYLGLAADYLKLLQQRLGVSFDIVKDRSWPEILAMAQRGEVDMLSFAMRTPERERYLTFTEPFKSTHVIIVDNGNGPFIGSLDNLSGKRLAIEQGYFMQELVREQHPDIRIVPSPSTLEALKLVAEGQADAYVGDAGVANYAIRKLGLLSLRFSGQTEFLSQHSVAIQRSSPELAGIMAKAIASIPHEEAEAIYNRWLGLRIEQGVSNATLLRYGAGALLLMLLFGYWVLRLKREVQLRKRSERIANEERLKLRTLFELSPLGIALTDLQGRFVETNPAFSKVCGYSPEALKTMDLWAITPERYHQENREQLATLERDGHYGPFEKEYQRPDGSLVPLRLNGILITSPDGQRLVWSIAEEISEQRRTEQTLKDARDAAESMAQAKSEFLANMSHEIRTPMNGIIGLSQLALNKPVPPDVRDYLEKIHSSSESLLGILNDILDFSKLEAGRMSIENGPFDLDTLLDNLRSLFEQRAQAKYLDFAIDVAPDIPRGLVGDVMRIQQILSNLLGNAIKFTAQGRVKLRVGLQRREDSQVLLEFAVEDTGIGISDADQQKLFQPFSQVDGSITRRFGGTGLGLAISQDLLRLMGSRIQVRSRPGHGACFSFFLQLGVTAQGGTQAPRREQKGAAGTLQDKLQQAAESLCGLHVLIAEDNVINQQVVSEFLKLSGMEVSLASNGQEVLDLLGVMEFDAILMDVHMPVMDGLQATRRIRANPQQAGIPVIALTAGVTEQERENCLAAGMNDFVPKPVKPETLLDALSKWCDRARPLPQAAPRANADEALPAAPGFDFSLPLQLLGGDLKQLKQILRNFDGDLHGYDRDIESCLARGDLAAARSHAHKIKGAAGNVGATQLHAVASRLDAELKSGQHDPASFTAFHQEVQRTRAAIRDFAGN